MTDFLPNYVILLLLFLVAIYTISTLSPKPQPKRNTNSMPKIKAKSHTDEVIDTLDWMRDNQIITASEYTKLVGKCLPFLEG